MSKMSFNDALHNLILNYPRYATREQYKQMLRSGIERGLSVLACYNGIRMVIGEPNEIFTIADVCSMTGETEQELIERIEAYRREAERQGIDPDVIARPIERTTYTIKL